MRTSRTQISYERGHEDNPYPAKPQLRRDGYLLGRLGFDERGRWAGDYLILTRPGDGVELHFWFKPTVDATTNDFACYIRWDTAAEARALHDEWATRELGSGRLTPPQETDYGLLEFALIDSHGNLLRIGGSVATAPGHASE